MIGRRNDRRQHIDNGTLGRITDIEQHSGALTIVTDAGRQLTLDGPYVAEHLEHAYALTGHAAQGATFDWAAVIGRPHEFTREWAYTALTRARDQTRIYLIAEATEHQRQRELYGPAEIERTAQDAIDVMTMSMLRREAEPLAIELPVGSDPLSAGHDTTQSSARQASEPAEPNWRALRRSRTPSRALER